MVMHLMEIDDFSPSRPKGAAAQSAGGASKRLFGLPSGTKGAAGQPDKGASKHLFGLPSRGFFSSPVISSNPGGMRAYVCEHETAPPESQVITTDTTNILIRAIKISNRKNELNDVRDGCTSKRSIQTSEGGTYPKKLKNNFVPTTSHQGSSSTEFSEETLQTMTVERLRTLLKHRGLSAKGRKDELIARLKDEP